MVPELSCEQAFALCSTRPVSERREAAALGLRPRPVILGPIMFLKLAKSSTPGFAPMSLLPKLVPGLRRAPLSSTAGGREVGADGRTLPGT